jgi:hypothetical protein
MGGACPRAGRQSDPRDAGKLIKGKKRHVLVDTVGLLLHAVVTSADVQDRNGGLMVLSTLFARFPFLKKLFADTAYAAGGCFKVIAHPTPASVSACSLAASTNRSTSSTEARSAFAVLTRERNAA